MLSPHFSCPAQMYESTAFKTLFICACSTVVMLLSTSQTVFSKLNIFIHLVQVGIGKQCHRPVHIVRIKRKLHIFFVS